MAVKTIATLKSDMPVGVSGGTSVQDIHNIVDTFDSRCASMEAILSDSVSYSALENIRKFQLSNEIAAPSVRTYVLDLSAPVGYTIDGLVIQTASGTATCAVQIGGVGVTGLTGIAASTTLVTATATALNVVSAGAKVTLQISAAATPTFLAYTLKCTKLPSRVGLQYEALINADVNVYTTYKLTASGNATAGVGTTDGRMGIYMALNHFTSADPMRTECSVDQIGNSPYFDNGQFAKIGGTYWYGISTYMPSSRAYDTSQEIIMQWHDYPDAGEDWKNPMVAITIMPNNGTPQYVCGIMSDSRPLTPGADGDPPLTRVEAFDNYVIANIAPTLGSWVDWVFRMKWGYDNTGETTVWMNGIKVLEVLGKGNCYNDQRGPYFKFGIYKWDWASPTDTGGDVREMFFDDIRIAAGPGASYQSVVAGP